MNTNIKSLKSLYRIAKIADIGHQVECPSCNERFIKINKQQAFCKTKLGTTCKDFYWNTITPNKKNNTTRISPANERYMLNNNLGLNNDGFNNFDEDQSWDAHKGGN